MNLFVIVLTAVPNLPCRKYLQKMLCSGQFRAVSNDSVSICHRFRLAREIRAKLSSLSRQKTLSCRPIRSRVTRNISNASVVGECVQCLHFNLRSHAQLFGFARLEFPESDLKPLCNLTATVLNVFVLEICIRVSESKRGY